MILTLSMRPDESPSKVNQFDHQMLVGSLSELSDFAKTTHLKGKKD